MDLSMAGCKRAAGEAVAEDLSSPKKTVIDNEQGKTNGKSGSERQESTEAGPNFKDLSGFQVTRVLCNGADTKRVTVQGKIGENEAVVILDKKPFSEENFGELFSKESKLERIFQNDIYGNYDCIPGPKASAIKATLVYPATPKHIEKYVQHEIFLVDETPELYEKIVLPHLLSNQFNIQWVFNILDHKKEADRIVFEDPDPCTGFILLPDLKWDGETLENLYLTAIVHAKDIKSLRDLRGEHLPLLKNILDKVTIAVKEKYGLSRSKLRMFFHYQPSYYHLHVHVTSLNFNAPGIYCEKSHLLQSVIANIELSGNHYANAVLPFVVKKNDPLYNKLGDSGYLF